MKKKNKNLTIDETFNLALQNHQKNNLKVAENLYEEILKVKPSHLESIFFLGSLLAQIKNFDRSKKLLNKAIQINPNHDNAYYNLGYVLIELREYKKAITCLEKAIQINPNHEKAYYNLGLAFKKLGKIQKAINSYEKAIQINFKFVDAYNNLGVAFKELNEFQKAIAYYEKAIQINPNYVGAYRNLGNVLKELGEYQKAITYYEKAIQIQPDYVDAHINLGITFKELNEFQKAIKCYQKAIKLKPYDVRAYNNLLFTLLYFKNDDSKYYLSQAKKFRLSLKPVNDNLLLKYQYNNKPEKLKIGFVSADFKQHPVGFFLLDTLKHLKNKDLELIAYSNSLKKDNLSIKLKSHFATWHEIAEQNNVSTINQIRKDGIHILFDLSGHSAKNRLPIFINRPAPIQVSWAGYAGSTGIPEIDYVIGDSFVTPYNESSYFTEKIFLLPNIWVCFSSPDIKIEFAQLPAIKNKYVTFGCFNNLSKVNDKVISLWSKILKSVSKSKIFLKTEGLNNLYLKKMIVDNFKKNNINSDSIILEGKSPRDELLASYNKVDISLDPFPYSGGATSFESIWMGVPVLSKKGSNFVSHVTESINRNTGMAEWIANDEEEYFSKAIHFASDYERLNLIRENLRKKVLDSPSFNASLFAEQFDNALWQMWNNFISKK